MKATDIKEIEAMTGAKVVAATKGTTLFNSDFVLLNDNGVIRQAFTIRDINGKMCIDVFAAEYDTIAGALAYLNMSDEELAQNIEYINPENNTPSTMNANETTVNHIRESISRLRYELQQYSNNASKGGAERRRNILLLRWDIRKLERRLKAMEADKATTTVTVSITDNGNRCEYTDNGKVIAAITYRKEFDAYDVNTPTVGYMTADVTEAHKACESGITWLLEQSGRKAAFDYSAVEEYNAAIA